MYPAFTATYLYILMSAALISNLFRVWTELDLHVQSIGPFLLGLIARLRLPTAVCFMEDVDMCLTTTL